MAMQKATLTMITTSLTERAATTRRTIPFLKALQSEYEYAVTSDREHAMNATTESPRYSQGDDILRDIQQYLRSTLHMFPAEMMYSSEPTNCIFNEAGLQALVMSCLLAQGWVCGRDDERNWFAVEVPVQSEESDRDGRVWYRDRRLDVLLSYSFEATNAGPRRGHRGRRYGRAAMVLELKYYRAQYLHYGAEYDPDRTTIDDHLAFISSWSQPKKLLFTAIDGSIKPVWRRMAVARDRQALPYVEAVMATKREFGKHDLYGYGVVAGAAMHVVSTPLRWLKPS